MTVEVGEVFRSLQADVLFDGMPLEPLAVHDVVGPLARSDSGCVCRPGASLVDGVGLQFVQCPSMHLHLVALHPKVRMLGPLRLQVRPLVLDRLAHPSFTRGACLPVARRQLLLLHSLSADLFGHGPVHTPRRCLGRQPAPCMASDAIHDQPRADVEDIANVRLALGRLADGLDHAAGSVLAFNGRMHSSGNAIHRGAADHAARDRPHRTPGEEAHGATTNDADGAGGTLHGSLPTLMVAASIVDRAFHVADAGDGVGHARHGASENLLRLLRAIEITSNRLHSGGNLGHHRTLSYEILLRALRAFSIPSDDLHQGLDLRHQWDPIHHCGWLLVGPSRAPAQ
mmetsp:Transcript_36120/g.104025  ORF Transcript_36120/g.104025 Transcript_36120/m.104025 type:complete len:342 (-) Transcript_36120:50-1075(-)